MRVDEAFDPAIGAWLTDLDGVLIREDHALDGAAELIHFWNVSETPYAVLTNNSAQTSEQIAERLLHMGIAVPTHRIWTAADATAEFLAEKTSGGVFMIGDEGMRTALTSRGILLDDQNPATVVIADTRDYSYERITEAARHLCAGARFVAASPDPFDPGHDGPLPSTGALCALLTAVTGRTPYVVGKPGSTMFRTALRILDARASDTTMIGDRLDTDILGAADAGIRTVLVRSGVAGDAELMKHPVAPDLIVDSVAALLQRT